MCFAIFGMGTAVPATTVTREQGREVAARLCSPTAEQATWLRSIYEHSGVNRRHLVLGADVLHDCLRETRDSGSVFLPTGSPEDRGPTTAQRQEHYAAHAGSLAAEACRDALAESSIPASRVTHLITVSCTGFHAPGVDIELIRTLGLSAGTQRTHIGYMGCQGALNGLRVASAFAKADRRARVLLCSVELCSLHYYYQWEPQKMVANALFADGAAALAGACPEAAPGDAWVVDAAGSRIFPDSVQDMTWRIGDHGFLMSFSRRVPGLIARQLHPWLTEWLQQQRLSLEDIRSWAVHPGGPKILEAVQESLELSHEAMRISREVLADNGNMSSPTILFILQQLRTERAPRPCVAIAFGPGLTAEVSLLR